VGAKQEGGEDARKDVQNHVNGREKLAAPDVRSLVLVVLLVELVKRGVGMKQAVDPVKHSVAAEQHQKYIPQDNTFAWKRAPNFNAPPLQGGHQESHGQRNDEESA